MERAALLTTFQSAGIQLASEDDACSSPGAFHRVGVQWTSEDDACSSPGEPLTGSALSTGLDEACSSPRHQIWTPTFLELPLGHLQALLSSVLAWLTPPTSTCEFSFRWTKVAAWKNLEILRGYGMNVGRAVGAQPFCSLTIGSEFRPVSVLAPLCDWHPLWHRDRHWLTSGIDYPLSPLLECNRRVNLEANLARGNHKSADFNLSCLLNMLKDELRHGWQMILPRPAVVDIPGTVLAPLGLVEQDTIDESGAIVVPKWQLIHDQSFNVIRNTKCSVAQRQSY